MVSTRLAISLSCIIMMRNTYVPTIGIIKGLFEHTNMTIKKVLIIQWLFHPYFETEFQSLPTKWGLFKSIF